MDNQLELNTADFEEDRYSRLRLISWWEQEKIRNAKVMVVGAGALENELVKNLTLLGIGNILIIDMDSIEDSMSCLKNKSNCAKSTKLK